MTARFTATLTEFGDVRVTQTGNPETSVYSRDSYGTIRVSRSPGHYSCEGEFAAVAELFASIPARSVVEG